MRSESICPQLIIERVNAAPVFPWAWIGQIAPAIIAALAVGIGWSVVEKHARRREQRADLRSAVLSLSDAISEVRMAALVFYGLPGNDPQAASLAAIIRVKIGSLSEQLNLLTSAGLNIDSAELLKRFRQSFTGGDFDSQARQSLPKDSIAFGRMNADAELLTREVHIAMLKVFLGRKNEAGLKSKWTAHPRPPLSIPGK